VAAANFPPNVEWDAYGNARPGDNIWKRRRTDAQGENKEGGRGRET